jgi:protein-S-isoprenylcysteine O-methyltransferase Ste14
MRALELKVPPPIVTILMAAAMWGLSRVLPRADLAGDYRLLIAIGIAVLGLSAMAAGVLAFRKARTTVSPIRPDTASTIVSTGIFGVTRNPMYLGMTLILIGWAVALSAPWLFIGPVAFALYITRFQITPEERVLSAKFGPAYETYRKQVRRWL